MTCACGNGRPVRARGVCRSCYEKAAWHGVRDDLPARYRRVADTVEDVTILRNRGMDLPAIAAELGMAPASVVSALDRYRSQLLAAGRTGAAHPIGTLAVPLRADLRRMRRAA